MNAKSKRSSEKSLLQSTSHLVVQGNPLVRNFTAEMSVNQLKLFYYLIGTVEKNDDSFYVVDVDYKTLYRLTTGDYIASGGKKYIDTLLREAEESFINDAVRTVDDRHLQCDIFLMDALRDEFRFDEISVICGNEAASSDESGILRVPEQPPQLALKKVHVIFLSF